jgi:hypothetical protein
LVPEIVPFQFRSPKYRSGSPVSSVGVSRWDPRTKCTLIYIGFLPGHIWRLRGLRASVRGDSNLLFVSMALGAATAPTPFSHRAKLLEYGWLAGAGPVGAVDTIGVGV